SIGISADGVAIIEMAGIAGLGLVPREKWNPKNMTTYGVGEAITYALEQGVHRIIVGLGGSITNDGGLGLLQALGATIHGEEVNLARPLRGRDLSFVHTVDLSTIDSRIFEVDIIIASDVTNPLYGEHGATYVFAPQKGANPEGLKMMDEWMERYVKTIIGTSADPDAIALVEGAGAAGGLGFALLLLRGRMKQGAQVVGDMIGLDAAIQQADLIITGEGKTDRQTLRGKAPYYVAKRGKHFSVPVVLVSGTIEDIDELQTYFQDVYALVSAEVSTEQAMQEARVRLTTRIKHIFRRKTK
ncbi:MAG TPA: glycerate kinase, partial [Bacillota bacterium]|nr:glycerate kinase [Bacillota bacterium]